MNVQGAMLLVMLGAYFGAYLTMWLDGKPIGCLSVPFGIAAIGLALLIGGA